MTEVRAWCAKFRDDDNLIPESLFIEKRDTTHWVESHIDRSCLFGLNENDFKVVPVTIKEVTSE